MFQYRPSEIEALCTACRELAEGQRKEFVLHQQPWVEPVGGCTFVWQLAPRDIGVRLPQSGDAFVLALSSEAWREVEGKLMPFAERSDGFNWLTTDGDVEVLISNTGGW